MQTPTARNTTLVAALFCLALASCSKDVASKQTTVTTSTDSEASSLSNTAISNAATPTGFLGEYTVRDEKTIYQGQANAQSSNVLIHLSYLDTKKSITPTADKKHLTMPVGTDYATSGWAYIIDYDKATKTITLSPNPAMQKDIVVNSFETIAALYNPNTKEGSFTTRFTALKDNGNESQLSESFWKE